MSSFAVLDSRQRDAVAARFTAVREQSLRLARGLSQEDCVVQSMPDASPVKWHLAHTTWFFETLLLERFEPCFAPFHPAFRVLFNSYYNAVGDKHPRPQRGLLTRPALAEVLAYRSAVDARMRRMLESKELSNERSKQRPGELTGEFMALAELGMQHEQQHQELILTDLKHLLSCNPLLPAYQRPWPLAQVAERRPAWVRFEGGLARVGHDASDPAAGFCFDNETPRHRVHLEDFELRTHPVSNGEYIEFIEDGGYARPELWLSMGWDTVGARGWQAPLYWEKRDGRWWTFTLYGLAEVDPRTPACHLSYFEADAYARWAGARLPTEFEWEHAAVQAGGQACSGAGFEGNFLESGALHPMPSEGALACGLAQLFGDVWEWTQSAYAPYPGFRAVEGAVGEYNGKFMCNQYVLRGGSCATPRSHMRATYRNFFPPDARWQFSGARLARDL